MTSTLAVLISSFVDVYVNYIFTQILELLLRFHERQKVGFPDIFEHLRGIYTFENNFIQSLLLLLGEPS
jgi:hypothetical protein